jgi:drug/metabolite transporter (DMT)-like permease
VQPFSVKNTPKHFLLLHLIVFIWGWSPILGKLISVQAFQLVWFRMFITLIAIAFYLVAIKQSLKVDRKTFFTLTGIGAVIAFHWFCFYHAIKISNVSVTLVAFSTGTLFTSIIEPVFYKRKVLWYEIIFGLIIVGAIVMIFNVEAQYAWGIAFGMLAAFTSSLFTVWNGIMVRDIPSPVITVYELGGGFAALSIYLAVSGNMSADFFLIPSMDWLWLSILAIVGTAFPFVASTNLLKKISPFTVTLTVNLETVYGIILAYFIWRKGEQMTITFYIGALIILATILANAILKNKMSK